MKLSQENKLRLTGLVLIAGILGSSYDIRPVSDVFGARIESPSPGNVAPARPTASTEAPAPLPKNLPRYIAHAGGEYLGISYSNSPAALENSYQRGYRLAEVDLNVTTDNQIVLLHDWQNTLTNVFGIAPGQRDLQTFLSETSYGPHIGARLQDLADWARQHPDMRITLDSKADAVTLLTEVATKYPELRAQFIPFIYDFRQYEPVSHLGFPDIALLVRGDQYSPSALVAFSRNYPLDFIAIQPATLATQLPALSRYTRIFCWTINDAPTRQSALDHGAYGVVTDVLGP